MSADISYPFSCDKCTQQPLESFLHFAATDDWIIAYPEERVIHVHFGIATWTDELSTEEALWTCTTIEKILTQHTNKSFFLIVDFTRSDDSEYPTLQALQHYGSVLKHLQAEHFALYGVSFSMRSVINILTRISSTREKVSIVKNLEAAIQKYSEWYTKK